MKHTDYLEARGAILNELQFWVEFVKSKRFLKDWLDESRPTPELDEGVRDFIIEHGTGGKVLDVGAGVASVLIGTLKADEIVSSDLLAPLYRCVFDYKERGVEAPLDYSAETLPYSEEFDIVHCRNAFDHVQEPLKAFDRMMAAVAPGGHLIIHGFECEANWEHGVGFHKWNVEKHNLRMVVAGYKSGELINFPPCIRTERKTLSSGKVWLTFIWQKKP